MWYEQYSTEKVPSHVLTGHIWSLFGIWDYYRVTGDKNAKKMFDNGIQVIKADINKYDLGYWVVAGSTNRVDVINGSSLVMLIQQMKVLHAITRDAFFDKYAKKWDGYQKNDTLFVHLAAESFLKSNFARSPASTKISKK